MNYDIRLKAQQIKVDRISSKVNQIMERQQELPGKAIILFHRLDELEKKVKALKKN